MIVEKKTAKVKKVVEVNEDRFVVELSKEEAEVIVALLGKTCTLGNERCEAAYDLYDALTDEVDNPGFDKFWELKNDSIQGRT